MRGPGVSSSLFIKAGLRHGCRSWRSSGSFPHLHVDDITNAVVLSVDINASNIQPGLATSIKITRSSATNLGS